MPTSTGLAIYRRWLANARDWYRQDSARDAVLGLRQLHYLTETIGGSRLAHGTESTKPDRKRISVPDERTENAPVSIDTVLSVRPSVPDSSNGAIHP